MPLFPNGTNKPKSPKFFVVASDAQGIPVVRKFDGLDQSSATSPVPELLNGVPPTSGDDLSPPNACEAKRLNAIVLVSLASAGWSSSPERQDVHPSNVGIDISIADARAPILDMQVALEYTNPFPDQSMCVHAEIAKVLASSDNPLVLVKSSFQDQVDGCWVDITASIAYTQTADAVVAAVMVDPTAGQTAGRVCASGETVDAKLGPIGTRGRILLTYRSGPMYEYGAMGVATDGSDLGTHRLVPLAVFMPWATIGSDVTTALSVTVATPPGTSILPPHRSVDAYEHLNDQDIMKETSMLVVPTLENNNGRPTFKCSWRSLPPSATSLMLWLAMPAATTNASGNFDFVDVAKELTKANGRSSGSATLLVPGPEDKAALTVPLPGFGPPACLYRMCVRVPLLKPARMPGQQHRVMVHLTISDASGSTGLRTAAGVTVRDRFNELAILRFRKRLASIPALLEAGVLSPDDVWVDAFFAFNHQVQEKFWLAFRVGDHAQHTLPDPGKVASNAAFGFGDHAQHTLPGPGKVTSNAAFGFGDHAQHTLPGPGKFASNAAFDLSVVNASQFVARISAIRPSGGTMFEAAADGVLNSYTSIMMKAASSCVTTNTFGSAATTAAKTSQPRVCTFVAFDTDGGDNDTLYVDGLREVVKQYNVVSGVVTGFGSWLNQHSATTIASLLDERIPPLLALTIPTLGTEGSNRIFRQSFIAWLDAVRVVPVTLAISAGAIKCEHPRSGELDLNALDVFAVEAKSGRRARLRFGPPDISDPTFTATSVTGCVGGDNLLLYIASRKSHLELAQTLRVLVNDAAMRVSFEPEAQVGDVLGHTWLTLMAQRRDEAVMNQNFCVPTLMTRIEDDLSFRLQLPTLSGSTSYLGRAKTQQGRPPIDALHTPAPPNLAARFEKLSRGKSVNLFGEIDIHALNAQLTEASHCALPDSDDEQWGRQPQPSTSKFAHCFGAASTSTAGGSGSALFGTAPTPTAVGSRSALFGTAPAPAAVSSRSALFGTASSPTAVGSGSALFGSASTSTVGGSGSALFGTAPTPRAAGGFAVGPSRSLFGGSMFGSSMAATTNRGRRFGWDQGGAESGVPIDKSEMPWYQLLACSDYARCGRLDDDETTSDRTVYAELSKLRLASCRLGTNTTTGENAVTYTCDICRFPLAQGTSYRHCVDCVDFDECVSCSTSLRSHAVQHPSHTAVSRVGVASDGAVGEARADDALVTKLLGQAPSSTSTATAAFEQPDRTIASARDRLRHLFAALLEWWPLIRLQCGTAYQAQLPEALDPSVVADMTRALEVKSAGGDKTLSQLGLMIVDTLMPVLKPH
jgi:hypothetical protein